MNRILIALLSALALTPALAKLPAPSDEAKAKAAEAAAKTAWSNKVANYQLCKSMDKVATAYQAQAKKEGKAVKAPATTDACADPGPFVYAPPPPLEAAGAHSPAKTATAPPSTNIPAAVTNPTKK